MKNLTIIPLIKEMRLYPEGTTFTIPSDPHNYKTIQMGLIQSIKTLMFHSLFWESQGCEAKFAIIDGTVSVKNNFINKFSSLKPITGWTSKQS